MLVKIDALINDGGHRVVLSKTLKKGSLELGPLKTF